MAVRMWSDVFVLQLPLIEKILRPFLVYVFLVIALRLAGKRELAQLNTFDLIVLLTISNTVQNAIIGEDNSVTGGVLGAATLLALNYIVVRFLLKHERIQRLIEGEGDILIDNGVVCLDRMKAESISRAELEVSAHKQGIDSLEEIERATLEPGGTFSFVRKKPDADWKRHQELLSEIRRLSEQVAALRSR